MMKFVTYKRSHKSAKLHDCVVKIRLGKDGRAKPAIFFSSLWLRKHARMVLMRLEWLGTCEPEQQHVCMQLDVLSTISEIFFFLNGLSVLCAHVHICTYTPMQVKMAS